MKLSLAFACLAAFVALGCGSSGESTDDSSSAIGSRKGLDYAWARPSPTGLGNEGYTFAARYLSYDNSKDISAGERQALAAHGVDVVVVWETTANRALSGYAAGASDAQAAESKAAAAGMPGGRPIYFAVDFDAQPSEQATIDAYFDGAASVLGRQRVGAYGGYYLIGRLFNNGKIAYGWQTYAWSYGHWDARAQLRQTQNDITAAGDGNCCDLDYAVAADFGQWDYKGGPTPKTLATHFEWAGHWLTGFGAPDWAGVGDFNGDGKSDVAWYEAWNNHSITVALSDGHAFTYGGKWLSGFGAPDWAGVGDFNGDGKSDVAWYEAWNGGSITLALSNGHGFEYGGKWVSGWGKPDRAFVGDFNGDGKSDVGWYEVWNQHGITVGLSTGHSLAWDGHWLTGFGAPDWAGAGDFNGDGKTDIAWYEAWNGGSITLAPSNGHGFEYGGKWVSGWGKPDRALVGDFNGDGKADVGWYEGWNKAGITVAISTGHSLQWDNHWLTGWGAPDWDGAGDFDGDGRADVAWYEIWNQHGITLGVAR
jgi:hypothetical protein